ncbi:MAG: 16S rRNA (adenine(1518)-N(6)/adenine(1519)-N(6))-dimethyltransferase RsmA [Chloroflexi bacterium]|nr:16S rRNA (adenine(1518)-N(6)/adenine(1519)-N(6))-dimethyltransferase RsmA [Chloroflexota bacterium]
MTPGIRPNNPSLLLSPRRTLARFGLRPKKSLGQNFATSAALIRSLVEAAELEPGDVVLEVGPGLGTLTRALAQRAGSVIAVEIDTRLMPILRQTLADLSNVHLIEGDILKVDPGSLLRAARIGTERYQVVANLPYYLTSHLLRHLLESIPSPERMVVTVQREVAQRIVAGPGQMSLLAVSVQFFSRPRLVARVPRGAFWPSPGVESAVLRLDTRIPPLGHGERERFFEMVRAGYSQRRKYLRNALAQGTGRSSQEIEAALRQAGLSERSRAQDLSVEDWIRLLQTLNATPSEKRA